MKMRIAVAALALAALAVPTVSMAAPLTYQAGVTGNNPYLYYRQQETGITTGTTAADFAPVNGGVQNGTYTGSPMGGVAGAGAGSDTAVSYPGTAGNYLTANNARSFGALVPRSSYEFVFKTNTPNPTNFQALFGVFNSATAAGVLPARTNTGAVEVTLNSNATGNTLAGTSRFYIRDEANRALGATIANGTLLDGNYHQLVFTYDVATFVPAVADPDGTGPLLGTPASGGVMAYVDGLPVPVTLVAQGAGAPTAAANQFLEFNEDPTFAARNQRFSSTGVINNFANVTIDEAALYGGTVLTPAQVAANATALGFVVPEPTSLAALGLAAVAGVRRRRA